ncbi:dual specificity protein phosphatase [Pseudacidovorax intermedius]|uniref:Dual specificity protein phosphatase n=1 Tax=Pseudacidovorax intermedius TaxID=433924 RepID=A0A370FCW7_9BURK|nr:dual specificity protein phosphatase family protein [Pseudacidovorax intermedius]RDI21934.1 dual specificity protein phosphatase [Pseudacidovorax intermedius]
MNTLRASPHFDWITPQLAVGGHVPVGFYPELAGMHGVRAVIDLREEDRDDEEALTRHGVRLLHLPTPDMCSVGDAHLDHGIRFAQASLDSGERLLIHCQWGIGRSATLALCVLVARGMPPLQALADMKSRRAVVSPSPAQLGCWIAWMERHRDVAPEPFAVPTMAQCQRIAYAHLMGGTGTGTADAATRGAPDR